MESSNLDSTPSSILSLKERIDSLRAKFAKVEGTPEGHLKFFISLAFKSNHLLYPELRNLVHILEPFQGRIQEYNPEYEPDFQYSIHCPSCGKPVGFNSVTFLHLQCCNKPQLIDAYLIDLLASSLSFNLQQRKGLHGIFNSCLGDYYYAFKFRTP